MIRRVVVKKRIPTVPVTSEPRGNVPSTPTGPMTPSRDYTWGAKPGTTTYDTDEFSDPNASQFSERYETTSEKLFAPKPPRGMDLGFKTDMDLNAKPKIFGMSIFKNNNIAQDIINVNSEKTKKIKDLIGLRRR